MASAFVQVATGETTGERCSPQYTYFYYSLKRVFHSSFSYRLCGDKNHQIIGNDFFMFTDVCAEFCCFISVHAESQTDASTSQQE